MEVAGDLGFLFSKNFVQVEKSILYNKENAELLKSIDALCQLRAQETALAQPLTTIDKLLNSDTNMYLAWEYDSRILAYLKVGKKHLYLYDEKMIPYEGSFICLLDFYVHSQYQRRGIGYRFFNAIIENEHIDSPFQMPLDNPTGKLLSFFSKKFNLNRPIVQNTGFIVFKELFKHKENRADEEKNIPLDWIRANTPRQIGIFSNNKNCVSTRWLNNAISGHSAAKKRENSPHNQSPSQEQAAQVINEAHKRKQQILSNQPLW